MVLGLDPTRANHVFLFDRWWNPAVEDQATDQAVHICRTSTVQVQKFTSVGTMEEKIDEVIESKKDPGRSRCWQWQNPTYRSLYQGIA